MKEILHLLRRWWQLNETKWKKFLGASYTVGTWISQRMSLKRETSVFRNTKQRLNSSTHWVSMLGKYYLRAFVCSTSGTCGRQLVLWLNPDVLWETVYLGKTFNSERPALASQTGPQGLVLAFSKISGRYILQRSVGSGSGTFRYICKWRYIENTSHFFSYLWLCSKPPPNFVELNNYHFVIIFHFCELTGYTGWFCSMWCQLELLSPGGSVNLPASKMAHSCGYSLTGC